MSRKIFLSAIIFYILILPFFYHSDVKEIYYKAQFLSQGVFNIYSYFDLNPNEALFGPFAYQPLTYFLFGVLFVPVKLIAGGNFVNWLAMGNNAVDTPHIFRYLFLMKFPQVITLLVSGVYLTKLFKKDTQKSLVLLLWLFNPITVYVVGMIGQSDIFPVAITLAALYYFREKPYLSSLLLGVGGALKGYPLFLIPLLAICTKGGWKKRLGMLTIGVVTFLLFIAPFLFSRSFYESAALSGLTQRMFFPTISFGFNESFLIIPALYFAILVFAINKDFGNPAKLDIYFFSTLSLFAIGVHFHAQWVTWFLPFLLIQIIKSENYKKPFYLILSTVFLIAFFGTVFLLNDKFLTWGLISAVDSAVFSLPTLFEVVGKFYDPFLLQSIFHTLLIIVTGSLAAKVLYEKSN